MAHAKNVKNTSEGALGLPTGEVIQPGTSVRVSHWDSNESNPVVKSWVEAGALVVSDARSEKAQGEEVSEEVTDVPLMDPEIDLQKTAEPAKAKRK